MIFCRFMILLVCFLVCSITPISALEMGGIEGDISYNSSIVGAEDNITSTSTTGIEDDVGDFCEGCECLDHVKNICRPNNGPDQNIIIIATIALLTLITIATGIYCYVKYPPLNKITVGINIIREEISSFLSTVEGITPEEEDAAEIISGKYLSLFSDNSFLSCYRDKGLRRAVQFMLDELEKGHFVNIRWMMGDTILNDDFCRVIGVLVDYNLEEEAACLIDLMKHNVAEEELLPALKMLKNTKFEVFKKIQPLLQFFKDI